MLGCAHEQKVCGGAVDRRGKQKPSVCDTREPYQTIWSIVKQVTWRFRRTRCLYESLRWLNLEIWQFLWWHTDKQTDRTDCFTPCYACACQVIKKGEYHWPLYWRAPVQLVRTLRISLQLRRGSGWPTHTRGRGYPPSSPGLAQGSKVAVDDWVLIGRWKNHHLDVLRGDNNILTAIDSLLHVHTINT
jgi:hypothetical protein